MAEIVVSGLPASAGLACGALYEFSAGAADDGDNAAEAVALAGPDDEAQALRAAIELAAQQLEALMSRSDPASAEIIEFQQAFVLDDELSAPAFAAIANGRSARAAWDAALADEITGYQSSDDDYFRARVADLEDLRQRVRRCLSGEAQGDEQSAPAPGSIIFAADLAPSAFLAMDWSAGGAIVLSAGSPNSHLAMLARSRGVAMIVGAQWPSPLPQGEQALVDAHRGEVIVAAAAATRAAFLDRLAEQRTQADAAQQMARLPAQSRDGTRIQVHINIASADELATLDPALCDGIGLFRTEFLFSDQSGFPDEDAQYGIYRRALEWAGGRPVVIRTLDAGADKPLPGLTPNDESNPFLGVRGVRLSLAHPEVLRVQLRALLRAAAHGAEGALRVMLPMVSAPAEIASVSALLDEELRQLETSGIVARRPPLGIMIEVPATAIAIDLYPADFYSIGSNDLTQYVMAAARDNRALAGLLDPANEAMLRLIANVVDHGQRTGRGVSLCGEAASDPLAMPALLGRGLRSLSVAPASVGRVKAQIAGLALTQANDNEQR